MALQYHPVNRGGHGRRLLLGGSATTQQPQPPWHSRQAARYYDSDDDSGIGHSNGGQGDRVGSTSSTETEVTQDFSSAQLSPGNLQKWWNSNSGSRPDGQRLPVDPWLSQQRVPPTIPLSLSSAFCPPAVSTPEGSECADDVFHPHKATLVRLPGPPLNGQLNGHKTSWKNRKIKPVLRHEPFSGASAFKAPNGLAVRGNLPESRSKIPNGPAVRGNLSESRLKPSNVPAVRGHLSESLLQAPNVSMARGNGPESRLKVANCSTACGNQPESRMKTAKGTLQKCKSFNHNSGLSQSERRNLGEGRRVWSYCGDGNYFPNVYENIRHGGNFPVVSQDEPLERTRLAARSRPSEASDWQKTTSAIARRNHDFGYLNREALAHHYDVPVSLGSGVLRENGRLQGAKSASLSSLITENDLVRVHAFPASVIPASEVGDALSDSFYVHHSLLELNNRYVQQPPPPPPPPMGVPLRVPLGLPRPRPQSIPNGLLEPPNFYAGPPPVPSVGLHQTGREGVFKDCTNKEMTTPVCTAGEVAYATVIKPKHKMNAGQKASSCNCSPASAFLDEIEPPLPPRNYRRDLASSKHLTTSKSSLTDKMQGFSRTAKQALRQAFSLEGLNCASESAHNDSDEWDNESDWGRIINPKPRTPSEVKARDANRQKLKRSNSTKHQPTTMATLC